MRKEDFQELLSKFDFNTPIKFVYFDFLGDQYYLKVSKTFVGNMKTEFITEFELSDNPIEYTVGCLLKTYVEDTIKDVYLAFQTEGYEDIFIYEYDIENSTLIFR